MWSPSSIYPVNPLIEYEFIGVKMPFYAVPIPIPCPRQKGVFSGFSRVQYSENMTLLGRLNRPLFSPVYMVFIRHVGTPGTQRDGLFVGVEVLRTDLFPKWSAHILDETQPLHYSYDMSSTDLGLPFPPEAIGYSVPS